MEQQTQVQALANHYLAQRQTQTPDSAFSAYQVQSIDQAFAVQQSMVEQAPAPVIGWKCLNPLDNGQLIFGPIIASMVSQPSICPIMAHLSENGTQALIEPEIGFVLGQDFLAGAQYSQAEVDNGIEAAHLALELIQFRFKPDYDATYFEKLADGLSNQGLFLGPQIDKALAYQASELDINVHYQTETQQFKGKHPCRLPASPLHWLINYLTERGVTLKKGQAIITGSYCGVVKVPLDVDVTIDYLNLGKLNVKFAAK